MRAPCVVSFGGGVNSTAMLVGMREREWTPDAILFADTGGERPETYEHLRRMGEWCESAGFPSITVVRYRSPHAESLEEECLNNETLPSKAFGFGGCSVKWKRQPMAAWLATWPPALAAWDVGLKVERLIGIHAGETRRGRIPDDARYTHRYPLREWGWGQEECVEAIRRAELDVPRKSSCFFCPAMRKHEIRELAREHPGLAERAIAIERNAIEAGSLETVKGLGRHWTWDSLIRADASQLRLFADEQPGICGTCFDGEDEPALAAGEGEE